MSDIDKANSDLANILDGIMSGSLELRQALSTVKERYWDLEDKTDPRSREEKLFVRTFWSIILLDEPEKHRTKTEELAYLRDCLRGAEQYDEHKANQCYGRASRE